MLALVDLLEPGRRKLDQLRPGDLHLRRGHGDRDAAEPAYRNALFRRRKNPSSSSAWT